MELSNSDKKFTLRSGNNSSFKQMGSSPAKKHDGTNSTTTHYKDGSAKSKREVAFSKRHESEKEGMVTLDKLPKGGKMETIDKMPKGKWEPAVGRGQKGDANRGDGDYQKRKEQLLNQGFTPEDADHMIKDKAVTGEVDKKAKPEHPKYEKKTPIKNYKKGYYGL